MQRRRIAVLVLAVGLAGRAESADHVLSGASLTLTRSASGTEKLTFVAKDAGFLFPAIGSNDDPATGTPGGATLELASTAQPAGAALVVSPGTGKPGWRSRHGMRDAHAYANPAAGPGPLPVKTVTLKQGTVIRVVAKGVGLLLAGPQGTVGVRLTTGTLRNCALFDGATIEKDQAGRFKASRSVSSSLIDCASLLPAPPTTTTTSTSSTTIVFAQCGPNPGCGVVACDDGATCVGMADFNSGSDPFICACVPPGVTPCGSDYPTCSGVCPNGGACEGLTFAGGTFCGCVNPSLSCGSPGGPGSCQPGVCAPGLVCRQTDTPFVFCGCDTP